MTTWVCIKGSDVWTAFAPGDDVGLKLVHHGEREEWSWRRREMAARRRHVFVVEPDSTTRNQRPRKLDRVVLFVGSPSLVPTANLALEAPCRKHNNNIKHTDARSIHTYIEKNIENAYLRNTHIHTNARTHSTKMLTHTHTRRDSNLEGPISYGHVLKIKGSEMHLRRSANALEPIPGFLCVGKLTHVKFNHK